MKDKRSGVCKCVKTFWSNSKLNPTCRKELLLTISHGSSSTIHSPNCRALNGRAHCQPKTTRVFKSKTKLMLIAFFDVHGIVRVEFLPKGQTFNQHVYKNIFRRLMRSVKEKKENFVKRGHGCFIMTMLQLIMPRDFGSFLPKITLLYWSNHPTL